MVAVPLQFLTIKSPSVDCTVVQFVDELEELLFEETTIAIIMINSSTSPPIIAAHFHPPPLVGWASFVDSTISTN